MFLKILLIFAAICSIVCFPGYFLPWDWSNDILEYTLNNDSNITIFLYRIQCSFFVFFASYFYILFKKVNKYKDVIYMASFLFIIMGIYMYILNQTSSLNSISSKNEPFVWITIGAILLVLNIKNQKQIIVFDEYKKYNNWILNLGSVLGSLFIIGLFSPKSVWMVLFKPAGIDYTSLEPIGKYCFGLVSAFIGFTSLTLFYLRKKILVYYELYITSLIYFIFLSINSILFSYYYNIHSWAIYVLAFVTILMSIYLLYNQFKRNITV